MPRLGGMSGMSGMSGQVGGVASRALPLGLDFSGLANGALPAGLLGSAWAIATAKAVATPALAAELLANPGFEGTYSSGLAPSWSKDTGVTIAESADVHLGAAAQEFTGGGAGRAISQQFTSTAGAWYRFGGWAKRTVGSAGDTYHWLYCADYNIRAAIDSALYAERVLSRVFPTAVTVRPRPLYQYPAGTGDTVIGDDASFKVITFADCLALGRAPFVSADVHVRAKMTQAWPTGAGIALRWDSPTNPQNGILVVSDKSDLRVLKCVAGTWSQVGSAGFTYGAGNYIGASVVGSTVKVWTGPYTAYYLRDTQTVADTEIASNLYHGLFSSDPTATFTGVGFEAGAAAAASGTTTTPKVFLVFDDFNGTDYTEAYTYLATKGLVGSSAGPSSVIDTGAYLTSAQMATMYGAGWDFCSHETLSGLSQSAQQALLAADRNWLETRGYTRASRISKAHSTDASTDAALTAESFVVDIGTGAGNLTNTPANYVLRGFTQETVYGHTAAELLVHADTAIVTNKQNFMVPFHAITTDSGLDISPTKFHDIIDGLIAAGYSFMTVSEYVSGMRY